MSTPQLPQPIYPGAPAGGAAPPPVQPGPGPGPGPHHGSPTGGPMGYAPLTPGGPTGPGGGAGPGRRGPNQNKLLLGAGGVVLAIAVAVGVSTLRDDDAPTQGQSTTTGGETSTEPGGSTTTEGGGGGGTGGQTPEVPSTPPTDLAGAVAYLWADYPTADEADCLAQAGGADAALGAAIAGWEDTIGSGLLSTDDAGAMAQASVDCFGTETLEYMVVMSAITPTCPSYEGLGQLGSQDWVTLLVDFYLTSDGVISVEEYSSYYFDMTVCSY